LGILTPRGSKPAPNWIGGAIGRNFSHPFICERACRVEVTTISRNVYSQHHPRADAIVYLYMEYSFLSTIGLAIGMVVWCLASSGLSTASGRGKHGNAEK
jgi:hypothetical protein